MAKSENKESSGASDLLVSFTAGDVIYQQGEAGSEMFLIEDGIVELVYRFGPKEKRAALLEPGDFFGEMSVLEDLPRNTTARALEASRLLPVDRAAFDQMLRAHPELLLRMMRKMAGRQRQYEEDMRRADRLAAGVLAEAAVPAEPVLRETSEGDEEAPMPARLVHRQSGESFPLDGTRKNLVGRHDPVTNSVPDVDLSGIDSKRTLSRRHASIWGEGGTLYIQEEMGAANGTFIDNKRLVPGQKEEIRNGTTVRFGLVEMLVEVDEGA